MWCCFMRYCYRLCGVEVLMLLCVRIVLLVLEFGVLVMNLLNW